jgi:ATP-binding cassette, subfamily B, multidrug efflux pump
LNITVHFLRRYATPYLHWYAAGTLMLGATNWLSVSIPLYLAEGIDALGLGTQGQAIILHNALMVALMGAAVIVVRTASRLLFFTPGRLVEAEVKRDLFLKMIRHQPAFLDQWPTGDLISRVSSDVNMTRLLAGFTALGIVNTMVAMTLTGTQMVRISPILAGWTLLPLVLAFLITLLFVDQLRALMVVLQRQAAVLSDRILSSYQGVAAIHAFQAEEAFQETFEEINSAYLTTMLKRANLRVVIGPLLALAASINVFILLFVGGPMAMRGEISVGELVAFTTLVALLAAPLRGLSFIITLFKQAEASIERIDAILLPDPDRPDLPSPTPAPSKAPRIEARNLSFTYPGDETPVLTGLSFEVASGTTVGILGPTGSGKTTLLRCLSRLYNPPPGTLFIDGIDILDIDLDAWRKTVAHVPQRAFLFSESVRENILLGQTSDDILARVLALAALEVDMAALPHGVNTEVGESGLTLSGGQRQRVAIARGLARPRSVLMLDDVLSAVDHGTEQELIGALRHQGSRPTTLIVANRISAIQHADLILCIEGGRLVDQGQHAELVERDGVYRRTWERQREGDS